jgi:hypothetical protein
LQIHRRLEEAEGAAAIASVGSVIGVCTMTNSSPPIRAMVSVSRTRARKRSATIFNSLSPAG